MASFACPICGDPKGYPFWLDAEPPLGCPHDLQWHGGGAISIRSVVECSYQRAKAWQAAEFRKLVPDAFDSAGNILEGQIGRVLLAFSKAHPRKELVI